MGIQFVTLKTTTREVTVSINWDNPDYAGKTLDEAVAMKLCEMPDVKRFKLLDIVSMSAEIETVGVRSVPNESRTALTAQFFPIELKNPLARK